MRAFELVHRDGRLSMHRMVPHVAIGLLLLCLPWATAVEPVQLRDTTANGWPARELANGLLAAAVVPSPGGRILSFRLGDHEFLWANKTLAGTKLEVEQDNLRQYPLVGGGFTWLAPQDRWTRTGAPWPPPPTHLIGAWTVEGRIEADGGGWMHTTGQPELRPHWNAGALRLSRRLAMRPGSARLIVEHGMANPGDQQQDWGLWSNVQVLGSTPGRQDHERFHVYFPVRRDGQYAPNGWMWYDAPGAAADQARPLGSTGVAEVQFLRRTGKLGADSDGGWICLVDGTAGRAFARRFTVDLKKRYAENRNTIAVYTSGQHPHMEIEVMGPMEMLAPGASAAFREEWCACSVNGPVLAVVEAGVISRRLLAGAWQERGRVNGVYGVFDLGTAVLRIVRKDGTTTDAWQTPVTPLAQLDVHELLDLSQAAEVQLLIRPAAGGELLLDRCDVPASAKPKP